MIELVPSIRVAILNPPVGLRVDAQVGAGLFLVSYSGVSVTGSFRSTNVSARTAISTSDNSRTGLGIQLGVPFSIGLFEIIPIYSAYNADGDWYNHFALNAGIRFGI